MIASIRLTNVEKIPLALCCISGLAIVLNFIECPLNCEFCPWESNINRKSARVLEIDPELINRLLRKYNPDILFLHGAEPYEKELAWKILRDMHRHEIKVFYGIKVNAEYIRQTSTLKNLYDMIKYVDVLLIEIIDWRNILRQLENIEQLVTIKQLPKNTHIELALIISSKETITQLSESSITEILKRLSIFPLNVIVIYDYSIHEIDRIAKSLRKTVSLTQFPTLHLTEYSSTLCPYCNMPLIVRNSGVTIKISLNSDGSCRYCNKKVIKDVSFYKAKKLYKVPIDIPIE